MLALLLVQRSRLLTKVYGPAMIMQLAGLLGLSLIYLVTPKDLDWHLATSAGRVSWQLLPVAAVILGSFGAELLRSRE